ncbi:MAG: ring-cleaving dioxygenase [Acidobacteriota bacterium]
MMTSSPARNDSAALRDGPERPLPGIHHVTAIASDPQRNLDFYGGLLGLRLVKKTVNFDAPDAYHLYYGDRQGQPGSILTFFPWPGARRGRAGAGQTVATAFSVPENSLGFWRQRLSDSGVRASDSERFGEAALRFEDPDGMRLELIAGAGVGGSGDPWPAVPAEYAIRGFDAATLEVRHLEPTAAVLDLLGFRLLEQDQERRRYAASGKSGAGARLDVLTAPSGSPRALQGAGTVHHVALRVTDEDSQHRWREHLEKAGLHPTEVKDRNYFRSIYFREPGGVLFELATDPPGFTVDEPMETLGEALKLPAWLEASRSRLEHSLPPLGPPDRASLTEE